MEWTLDSAPFPQWRFTWLSAGDLKLDRECQLVFPDVPQIPGIYRFEIESDTAVTEYIGNAIRLRRRFQLYRSRGRKPGKSNGTTTQLARHLLAALGEGHKVTLALIGHEALDHRGVRRELDFADSQYRVAVEAALIRHRRAAGFWVLNKR